MCLRIVDKLITRHSCLSRVLVFTLHCESRQLIIHNGLGLDGSTVLIHTLMTAGHVVYIKNSGIPGRHGSLKSIIVKLGRNGNISLWANGEL